MASPAAVTVVKTWNGNRIAAKAARAQARAIIDIGHEAVLEAKNLAHVLSGAMRASIHTFPADYEGGSDEQSAVNGVDLQDSNPVTLYNIDIGASGVEIGFGSFVTWAIVEEEERGHKFIEPAAELAARKADGLMIAAFKQEGL